MEERRNYNFLIESNITNLWQSIKPDARHTWLTEGLHAEFDAFIPMGSKEAKAVKGEAVDAIFKTYSRGVTTRIVMHGFTISTETRSLKT